MANNSSINKDPASLVTQNGSQLYAADAGSNDTYVISLSPALTAYTVGMTIAFKANTANTGAATLNVNGLGAVTIKKNHDQDLSDNDIEVGQIVLVTYDGTNFQMQSQVANVVTSGGTYAQGKDQRDSGTGAQTITHSMGVVPKLIKIRAYQDQGASSLCSDGAATSTSSENAVTFGQAVVAESTTSIIYLSDGTNRGEANVTAITSTNFEITWTTAPNVSAFLKWETFG